MSSPMPSINIERFKKRKKEKKEKKTAGS